MKNHMMMMLLTICAGCAYMHDRARDTCDVVTVAAEAPSFNASVQLCKGVLGVGLAGGKGVGLRSGALGIYDTGEANFILGGFKALVPSEADMDRDKGYDFQYLWFPWESREKEFLGTYEEGKWFNAWQIEAAVGLGVGVRAGFNPVELLDFLLGWTTLDICGDDVNSMARNAARAFENTNKTDNQASDVIGAEAAPQHQR